VCFIYGTPENPGTKVHPEKGCGLSPLETPQKGGEGRGDTMFEVWNSVTTIGDTRQAQAGWGRGNTLSHPVCHGPKGAPRPILENQSQVKSVETLFSSEGGEVHAFVRKRPPGTVRTNNRSRSPR